MELPGESRAGSLTGEMSGDKWDLPWYAGGRGGEEGGDGDDGSI